MIGRRTGTSQQLSSPGGRWRRPRIQRIRPATRRRIARPSAARPVGRDTPPPAFPGHWMYLRRWPALSFLWGRC